MVYMTFALVAEALQHSRAGACNARKEVRVMAKCEICGKGPQFGHNVSHSNVRTKRLWRPNIQKATVVVNGVKRQLNVCAKCLKKLGKT